MKKKIIYVAHPIASDEIYTTEQNLKNIERIVKHLNLKEEVIAIAPYYLDCVCMEDYIPHHRIIGVRKNKALIETGCFDEIWLFGHKLSMGMREECLMFIEMKKPVINFINVFI